MQKVAEVIYEANVVKRLKRVGFQILGVGEETVGEHTFLTCVISYFLANELEANLTKILTMSIFHDFHEARTGDVNKLAKQYVTRDQNQANRDIFTAVDKNLIKLLEEYEEKTSLEAKIVYEANILALLVQLKPLAENGSKHAEEWLIANSKRLRLPQAKYLAKTLLSTDSQSWWSDIRRKIHEQDYLDIVEFDRTIDLPRIILDKYKRNK